MIAIAHLVATLCYLGAAALAAAPFARPVRVSVRWVTLTLAAGTTAHIVALVGLARTGAAPPLTGLGPALSFAALALAGTLLVVELLAREASLTLLVAPLAAIVTIAATTVGLVPAVEPPEIRGPWFVAHIALSFIGIAGLGTAAAAGTMYLVQRRELRSRRFGALFRLFPPLQTLDRVNHGAVIAAWIGLTLGITIGAAYAVTYRQNDTAEIVWGTAAWLGATILALGRIARGWQARRAAIASGAAFAAVIALWIVVRLTVRGSGDFL
ncbi:MAG TPA: cytochrome c biogenesis protein CcsA [Gemmatimonadaceae bacterium]|nr:cytochrome c biogenesis protein CcsA [Gemmatimonadaceae bacterium]